MTILDIIILGYIVNFFITVYMVIYYLVIIWNEGGIHEIRENRGKPKVPSGNLFPYGSILERILVRLEYRKFKKEGGGTLAEFINYMFEERK